MKNNLEFYQHYADADQHPKFKMLRVQFGWAGEGKFWALNNRIAQAKECKLDISKKYNKAAVASDLSFNIKEFDEFIEFLINDCELVDEVEPGVITTEIVQENYQRVDTNRLKARERKQRYLEKVKKGSDELSKGSGEQSKKGKGKGKGKGKEKIYRAVCKRLIEKINELGGKKFRLTETNFEFIIPRLKEGFTEENCLTVIDNKHLDPNFSLQYFKPETLFRKSKFEGYLNEDPSQYKAFGENKPKGGPNENQRRKDHNHGFDERTYEGTPEGEIPWLSGKKVS